MVRRLTAIMAVDMVGSSRLMEADEVGTLTAFKDHRERLVEPAISRHHGRTVKLTGDGALVEFASVVEAVTCALAIQDGMAGRNEDIPEDRRIVFRIGVHLGDVMAEEEDIYGDGVNVAARLEALAEPGGICISQQALDQVETKLDLAFDDMGEQRLKNIGRPVRAYAVRHEGAGRPKIPAPRRKFAITGLIGAVAVGILVAVGVVYYFLQPEPDRGPEPGPLAIAPLAGKPSMAVLPFENLSGDPDQEYFADGMTEDLITDLSKISNLEVLPRGETTGFKGLEMDVREVGEMLSVRYVIQGSVRKAGEQVRINAKLIDASTGVQLWADRYDGALGDIFGLQDRVLAQIVDTLALRLSEEERKRLAFHGTKSVAAHDLYMQGLFQESTFTLEGDMEAVQLYEQALAIDPSYALPYTRISNILQLHTDNGWSQDMQADLAKAVELAEKAAGLDPQNPYIHWSLSRAFSRLMTPEALQQSISAMEQAIELDQDFADAYAWRTVLYISDGRAEDGLRSVETAMRLNPRYPFWYLFMRGMTRYVVEDYETAIADFEVAAERSPTAPFVRWWLAAAYAQAGRLEDAEWQVDELQGMGFDGTIATVIDSGPIQDLGYVALIREGLRKAGLPE